MKRELFIMLLFALLFGTACDNRKTSGKEIPDEVVLIFENAPEQMKTGGIFLSGTHVFPAHIRFIDADFSICDFVPRNIGLDTLIIPAFDGVAEVWHTYQAKENMVFLFQAGDTVRFHYDPETRRPRPESLTDERLTSLYNLLHDQPGAIHKTQYSYSPLTILRDREYIVAYRTIKGTHPRKAPPELFKRIQKAYIDLDSLDLEYGKHRSDYERLLDRMKSTDEIPEAYFDYYTLRLNLDRFTRQRAYEERDDISDRNKELETYFYRLMNDDLVRLISYQILAQDYTVWLNFSERYPYRGEYDPFAAFDRIAEDERITPQTRKIMLDRQIGIIREEPLINRYVTDVARKEEYTRRYEELTGNMIVRDETVENPNIIGGYTMDVALTSLSGEKYTLDQVLEKHKGKVVYVDFWASWCAPCIAGMPAAKKIREEYKSKEIVFLYLAYNDNPEKWQPAVAKHETDYLGENYFVENKDASFFREIDLQTIPRFLIYDKVGVLRELDAPRPESPEIRSLLDRYLEE